MHAIKTFLAGKKSTPPDNDDSDSLWKELLSSKLNSKN